MGLEIKYAAHTGLGLTLINCRRPLGTWRQRSRGLRACDVAVCTTAFTWVDGSQASSITAFFILIFLNHVFFSNFVNFWSFQKCVNNINQKHENSLRNILIFCKMLSYNPPSHLLPIPNLNANPSAALGGGYLQYPQDLRYLIPCSVNSYMRNLNLSVNLRAACRIAILPWPAHATPSTHWTQTQPEPESQPQRRLARPLPSERAGDSTSHGPPSNILFHAKPMRQPPHCLRCQTWT